MGSTSNTKPVLQPKELHVNPVETVWENLGGFHEWSGERLEEGSTVNLDLDSRDGRLGLTLRPRAEVGRWVSPTVRLYQSLEAGSRLIPSWQTLTPKGSDASVSLQMVSGEGESGWYDVADWALHASKDSPRTSKAAQKDDFGAMSVDTFVSGRRIDGYRVLVDFHSKGSATPRLIKFGVQVAPVHGAVATSETTITGSIELPVPEFSQHGHKREFPAIDGGGDNWCSSTSTAMDMAYWGVGPTAAELNALPFDPLFGARGRKEPEVVHAALHTYDSGYGKTGGTGNWSFNTAYASEYGLDATVRFFPSLIPVEELVKKGVPVVASLRWPAGGLPGAALDESSGHLVVIRGFRPGKVIVNDPATHGKLKGFSVRREYDRPAFEASWSGIAYAIAPWSY